MPVSPKSWLCLGRMAVNSIFRAIRIVLAAVVGVIFCLMPLLLPAAAPPRKFALHALSSQFWKLIPRHSKLIRVATGFGFTEGPVWDKRDFLYVSDEVQNRIYRVYPNGNRETVIALGDPDGNTYNLQNQLIDCASVLRAIIRVTSDGKYVILADRYQGKRFNSPNDVVLGPDKALYFTDPTLDLPKGQKQEIPFQGVYRLGSDGDVRLLTQDLTQPNGLAFSPDGKLLYIDDSAQRNIRVYQFNSDGTLSKGRVFGSENDGLNDGVPDGMKVDLKGNLYVVGARGIWVWDREGHHLGTIVMPEQPTNLTWGGADYGALYITATTSVYRIRTSCRGFVPYLAYARSVNLSSGHSAGVSLEAKAFAAYREGRLNEARPCLEQVIENDPHSAPAHAFPGLTLARQNDFQHGLLNLQQAYEINPGNPDFAYDYSVLLLEAQAKLEEAARCRPHFALAEYRLGQALSRDGKSRQALSEFEEAIRYSPALAEPYYDVAQLRQRLGDQAGAREVLAGPARQHAEARCRF